MADTATAPVKKRKPQGPRVIKPKTFYVMAKGTVDDLKVFEDADAAIELTMNEPGAWKLTRYQPPAKKKATAAPAA